MRLTIEPAPGVIDVPLRRGCVEIACALSQASGTSSSTATILAAYDRIVELRLPLAATGRQPGEQLAVRLSLRRQAQEVEGQPLRGAVIIRVPTDDDAARQWTA